MHGLTGLAEMLLRRLPPETAHRLAIRALSRGAGLAPRPPDPTLRVAAFGLDLANPLGLAAGFDKDAEALPGLATLGLGFVEVGTVTPRPQPGNPRPRLFRLRGDGAVINRMGFNNAGLEAMATRLSHRPPGLVVGANIGCNKDAADPVADFAAGARRLVPLADYLVVNVSSPNTPGLRALQGREALADLLLAVTAACRDSARQGRRPTPLLVKVAPDLDPGGLEAIVETAIERGVDGLILTNTTVARPPSLRGRHRRESGGLSGRPLLEPSTALLRRAAALSGRRLMLVGVGGVASGGDAYAKIRAGATLVQLYSGLALHGAALIPRILTELGALLRRDGFRSPAEAVGSDL